MGCTVKAKLSQAIGHRLQHMSFHFSSPSVRARTLLKLRLRIVSWCVGLLLTAVATTAAATGTPIKILVLLGGENDAYQKMAQSIGSTLAAQPPRAKIELDIEHINNLSAGLSTHPTLVITIGPDAARAAMHANPASPILYTLIPRTIAQEILRNGRDGKPLTHRDSAIFLDQPIGRQLDLLRIALPKRKQVAMILGPSTRSLENELRNGCRERSLTVETATINQREELIPALEHLLGKADILLSAAEPMAYDGETLHHVLLTTYRYGIPVIGQSEAYVDAGALLAIYSTPEQIGRQVGELLNSKVFTKDALLPPPSYPKYFTVSINRRVASSLDLQLENETTLQTKLRTLSH